MNRRTAVIDFLAVALAALALAGCDGSANSRAAVEPAASGPKLIQKQGGGELLEMPAIPGMTVVAVKEVQLPGVLETSGQVTFDDRRVASIVSRVAGRIEDVRVSQWDNVSRGEQIVALYSPDFMTGEAEYLQAQTTTRLSQGGGIQGTGDLAQSIAQAAVRKLELLGMEPADVIAIKAPSPTVWMRAPISGTVVEKKAVRGAQVAPGDVLFTLGTLENVWITADIYEADLARVREGQELEAVATAFPDETFKGVITRVSPDIDPNTHILQIRCDVKNPSLKLKPQMLVRVRIVTRPGSALVVPQEALVFETDGYYAFVVTGVNALERRRVVIGSWNERGFTRVVSGLSAGERVVSAESIQVNALWHQAHGESS